MLVIASSITPASLKRAGLRIFFIHKAIVSKQRANNSEIDRGDGPGGIHLVATGAELEAAPVVMAAEAVAEPLASRLAGFGETEQLAPVGAPEQEKLTIPE